jgi:hypothetical protein
MKDTSTEDTALSIGHSLPGECVAGGYVSLMTYLGHRYLLLRISGMRLEIQCRMAGTSTDSFCVHGTAWW